MINANKARSILTSLRWDKWVHWCSVACLLALTVLIHWTRLESAGPLFRDEAHEVNFANRGTIADVWDALWMDSSPALYKYFLRFWSLFGDSDWWFRLSAFVLSMTYLGLVFGLFAMAFLRKKRRTFPVLSLAFPVLSPFVVEQQDALRPYGLALVLMVAFFASYAALLQRCTRLRLVVATLLGGLAANTSYHACFWVAGVCVAGAVSLLIDRKSIRAAALMLFFGLGPLLMVLPNIPAVQRSSSWVGTQQQSLSMNQSLRILSASFGERNLDATLVAIGAVIMCLLLTILPRPWLRLRLRWGRAVVFPLLTALLFTFSVTASFAASGIAPTPLRFVPVVLMAALCCDLLVSAIPPAFGTALSAVLAVVCVSSLDDALRHASRRASNVDVVAQAISDQAEAEDLVVLRSWSSAISFARYYKGRAPFVTIPDLPDHQIHRYDLLIEKFRQSDRTEDVMRGVERTFSSGHKVYLVGHFRPVPLEPIVPELPPAPHPRFGYFKVPYLWNSEDRVFQHVLRRATSLSLIPLPTHHTVSARENLPLRVARGAISESAKP